MDGGDRAGYKQISKNVDAIIITSTMGETTCDTGDTNKGWIGCEVISSKCAFAGITAAGITNASLITSGTSYNLGAWIGGGGTGIQKIKISTKSTGHRVIAYKQVLL